MFSFSPFFLLLSSIHSCSPLLCSFFFVSYDAEIFSDDRVEFTELRTKAASRLNEADETSLRVSMAEASRVAFPKKDSWLLTCVILGLRSTT